MKNLIKIYLPFLGFYHSIYESQIDGTVQNMNDDCQDSCLVTVDYPQIHKDVSETYTSYLVDEINKLFNVSLSIDVIEAYTATSLGAIDRVLATIDIYTLPSISKIKYTCRKHDLMGFDLVMSDFLKQESVRQSVLFEDSHLKDCIDNRPYNEWVPSYIGLLLKALLIATELNLSNQSLPEDYTLLLSQFEQRMFDDENIPEVITNHIHYTENKALCF